MKRHHIHIDIESKSPVSLNAEGVYLYATHPETDVLCICYAIDHGPVVRWEPRQPFPAELLVHMQNDICWAHNAAFERLMFEHVILPKYASACTPDWRCTAVLARAYGLPSALGDVARFIGLPAQKSGAGMGLIRKMSIPPYEWSEQLLTEMLNYCEQDVQVERMIALTLPDVVNWDDYNMSERINDRGILVDVAFAKRAATFAQAEKADIKERFIKLTGENSPQSRSYTKHLHQMLSSHSNVTHNLAHWMSSLVLKDGEMVEKLSLARDIVDALLERSADLPEEVVEALELKQRYSRSSSAKFATMVNRAGSDDRVRGSYLFLGASKTGRYSARGLQMHNMPRDSVDDPEAYIVDGDAISLEVLPALIRPTLYAPEGTSYVCSDWAGIEARALPWLSDMKLRNRGVLSLLALFRSGGDIYVKAAAEIYKITPDEVTKAQRQIGKVAILSLGYGGSLGAFKSMAAGYGVVMADADIERVVAAWRENNTWATRFWKRLMAASVAAVQVPGSIHWSGRVYWVMEGDVLYCTLPSGRRLAYVQPILESPLEAWMGPQLSTMKASIKPAAGATEWPRERLWGGLIAENVCQATCADILTDALVEVDAWCMAEKVSGLQLVGHTHDELIVEAPSDMAICVKAKVEAIMKAGPDWASGLPLDVESWIGGYYRK